MASRSNWLRTNTMGPELGANLRVRRSRGRPDIWWARCFLVVFAQLEIWPRSKSALNITLVRVGARWPAAARFMMMSGDGGGQQTGRRLRVAGTRAPCRRTTGELLPWAL